MKPTPIILAFLSFIASANFLLSQDLAYNTNIQESGVITGTVRNSETGHVVPNISVIVLKNGDVVTGTVADERGKFQIEHLASGSYDIKIVGSEFQEKINSNIVVAQNKITHLEPNLTEVDFVKLCIFCNPKSSWSSKTMKQPGSTENTWTPGRMVKQSVDFNIFFSSSSN